MLLSASPAGAVFFTGCEPGVVGAEPVETLCVDAAHFDARLGSEGREWKGMGTGRSGWEVYGSSMRCFSGGQEGCRGLWGEFFKDAKKTMVLFWEVPLFFVFHSCVFLIFIAFTFICSILPWLCGRNRLRCIVFIS